ncbi:MAG: Uma2 family endonuclease [Spirochaetota bacterium]
MGEPALKNEGDFTYKDYVSWPDDERWEMVDGVPMAMAAPSVVHQRILMTLSIVFAAFLEGKACEVLVAPLDVLIPDGDEDDDDIDTVVQPDIMVFCDRDKLLEKYARGAPELVVEILSPSTSKWDQNDKFRRYERAGVREYWVIDPLGRWLCVYASGPDGKFGKGDLYEVPWARKMVSSTVLEGFSLDPARIFAEKQLF